MISNLQGHESEMPITEVGFPSLETKNELAALESVKLPTDYRAEGQVSLEDIIVKQTLPNLLLPQSISSKTLESLFHQALGRQFQQETSDESPWKSGISEDSKVQLEQLSASLLSRNVSPQIIQETLETAFGSINLVSNALKICGTKISPYVFCQTAMASLVQLFTATSDRNIKIFEGIGERIVYADYVGYPMAEIWETQKAPVKRGFLWWKKENIEDIKVKKIAIIKFIPSYQYKNHHNDNHLIIHIMEIERLNQAAPIIGALNSAVNSTNLTGKLKMTTKLGELV